MSVAAYHPETGHNAILTEEQLIHMRMAGWMLQSEWDEQQAARAAAQAAADEAAKPPAAKTAKNA